jgi:hypothetical protein
LSVSWFHPRRITLIDFLAVFSMVCDHVVIISGLDGGSILYALGRSFGRLALPIYIYGFLRHNVKISDFLSVWPYVLLCSLVGWLSGLHAWVNAVPDLYLACLIPASWSAVTLFWLSPSGLVSCMIREKIDFYGIPLMGFALGVVLNQWFYFGYALWPLVCFLRSYNLVLFSMPRWCWWAVYPVHLVVIRSVCLLVSGSGC